MKYREIRLGSAVSCDGVKGKVKGIYREAVTKKIAGERIICNGSKENPAYWIEQPGGKSVFKLRNQIDS